MSSRSLGPTVPEVKKAHCPVGAGNRKRPTSTRSVDFSAMLYSSAERSIQIQQTPDLSSLDPEHLTEDTLARLPYLTRLKDTLYSKEFRDLMRGVTGCGPLSGKKTDGSVGLYTRGWVASLDSSLFVYIA